MLSYKAEILWQQPLNNLHVFNKTIEGLNQDYQIVTIDVRNQVAEKVFSFLESDLEGPCIKDAKYLHTEAGIGYFFSLDRKIVSAQGQIVDQSNSKADFQRGLDAQNEVFLYAKYHKLHQKYSINVKRGAREKKIIKLMDEKISKINLVAGEANKSILVEASNETVGLLYGQGLEQDQQFPKVNRFQMDHNYVYLLTGLERRQSPSRQSKFNSEPSKVRVEVFDKGKIGRGKGYSQLEFSLPRYPVKMDSFHSDLVVAFQNSLQIYDLRKMAHPFQTEAATGLKDFIYDPNLQRVYLSSRKGLIVYDYK